MTPQERKLIEGVGQRLRGANVGEKDVEAEDLIKREIEAQPDAAYVLTQAVILQEHALKRAQTQIEDLKKEAEQVRQGDKSADQQAPGASFLGGLFGGGRQTASPSRARAGATSAQRDPWGGGSAGAPPAAAAPGGGFGGFMKSAATMAVGVAGGALLAGAIQDMFAGEDEQPAEQLAEETTAEDSEPAFEEPLADANEFDSDFDQDFDVAESSDSGFDFGDDDWA